MFEITTNDDSIGNVSTADAAAWGIDDSMLTDEQKAVLDGLDDDRNMIVLGGAGTGKSVLVGLLEKRALELGLSVLKASFTGVAAKNIGGCTVSSLFRLGKGVAPTATSSDLLESADIVIIDEVSTVRADYMDAILEYVRDENDRRGFAGRRPLKIVLVGDLYQLSPVAKPNDKLVLNKYYERDMGNAYPHQAKLWNSADLKYYGLNKVFRQKDQGFADALNEVRRGNIEAAYWIWQNCAKEPPEGAMKLLSRNVDVEKANMDGLLAVGKKIRTFEHVVEGLVDNPRFPEKLHLCKGARVMTLVNNRKLGFVNGSLGTVCGFDGGCVQVRLDSTGHVVNVEAVADDCIKPVCEDLGGKKVVKNVKVGSQLQLPLKLAYATTIHKSQGLTLEKVIVDPACFCCGQLYVALSRARSLDGLYLTSKPRPSDLKVDPEVVKFMKSLEGKN